MSMSPMTSRLTWSLLTLTLLSQGLVLGLLHLQFLTPEAHPRILVGGFPVELSLGKCSPRTQPVTGSR